MAAEVVAQNPDEICERIARAITIRTNQAVQLIRNDAVRALNRSQPVRRTPSGRLVGLAPSNEGEAPKRLSGLLVQTLFARVTREGDRIVGVVGSPRAYARRLEFGFVGTDARGRTISQGPRPFLRPAFEANRERISRLLSERVGQGIRLAGSGKR